MVRGGGKGVGLNRGMLRRPLLSVAPVEDGLFYSSLKSMKDCKRQHKIGQYCFCINIYCIEVQIKDETNLPSGKKIKIKRKNFE